MKLPIFSAILFLVVFQAILLPHNSQTQAEEFASVYIKDIPHVLQKPDFCGEACTEMFLKKLGHKVDQDFVFDQSGLDPLSGRGCYTRDLVKSLQTIRFDLGKCWYTISASESEKDLTALFSDLHRNLKRGIPSIVCTRFDFKPNTTEHFRLVIGYDNAKDQIIYHDPALSNGANLRMSRSDFLNCGR